MPSDLCVVCGGRSNTFSFGVFCCRACGAFFRRSQTKKYVCRRENRCSIEQEGMRNACRACRLARCYKAGMTVEAENKPQPPSSAHSASSPVPSVGPPPSVDVFYPQVSLAANGQSLEADPSRFPFIHKVLTDFQTLQRSQKSLYSIENPQTIFGDTEFHPISKTLFKRMENGTNSLINNLIYETLDFYGCLESKMKIEIAKQVSQKYAGLYRCFLTAKHFPNAEDKRVATHYGYYIDPTNIQQFAEEPMSPVCLEQKAKLIVPILIQFWRVSNKFRELQVRELEVAALASVFIWCQLEDMDLMSKEMEEKRDATHREFHSNVIGKYGVEMGSTRLVRVLSLIQDILNLNASFQEMLLLASIFSPMQEGAGTCPMLPAFSSPQ